MVLKGPVGLMATKERYVQASEKEQETKCVMFISSSGSGPVPHFHHEKPLTVFFFAALLASNSFGASFGSQRHSLPP